LETHDSTERVDKVAHMLDQLLEYFQFHEDSDDLRLLIVVEEAHLWTSKDLPKDALRFLDTAVRLPRKKGVGVMLVSQKISDFDPAMRSAMNISILFRTKYEADLKAIARMLGTEISAVVPRLPGLLRLSFGRRGRSVRNCLASYILTAIARTPWVLIERLARSELRV